MLRLKAVLKIFCLFVCLVRKILDPDPRGTIFTKTAKFPFLSNLN